MRSNVVNPVFGPTYENGCAKVQLIELPVSLRIHHKCREHFGDTVVTLYFVLSPS
jgi:hypothetical protein